MADKSNRVTQDEVSRDLSWELNQNKHASPIHVF